MLDLRLTDEAKIKAKPSRGWRTAATVIAVIGILAALGFHLEVFEPAANAANYSYKREAGGPVPFAAGVTATLAPLVSILVGLIGRGVLGMVPGVLALLFTGVWVPPLLRACRSSDETSMIGVLRAINSSPQAYSSSCANGYYAAQLDGTQPIQ